MSNVLLKIKEENEFIKKLFDFNGVETHYQHPKTYFLSLIQNSKNDPKYFVDLLKHYSKCRPHQQLVSKELVGCVYSCFPEQTNEIQQKIKEITNILRFIVFPEEF